MPRSGDQGVKPESEKLWPEIWHGEGENPEHGVSPFSESGRFKILPNGTKINLHKTQTFQFSGRRKVEDVAIKEAEQDIARNLQLQGNFFIFVNAPFLKGCQILRPASYHFRAWKYVSVFFNF